MFPTPMFSSLTIIDRGWPAICYILSWVGFIVNLQVRSFLSNLVSELFNWKAYGSQVVGHSVLYLLYVCLHYVYGCFNRIIDVHHGQSGLLFNKTRIFALSDTVIENSNSIVSSSSSWLSLPTYYPWISHTPYI